MYLIRFFEERCGELYMQGKIRGFLHLYIGEEAIAVGTAAALEPEDYVVTHYRDHGHAIARGIDPKRIMAELFGKSTGTTGGKGGSMHLVDSSKNFTGGYAIVGGQFPIATGLALAAKQSNEKRMAICYFGDGALNQGEFHEAFNLASIWKLPVLFLLENNFYGMGSGIERTFAGGKDPYKVADHYKIPSVQIDGMNLFEVKEATKQARESIISGAGPYFIEAICYRFRGHSMADPMNYRDQAEDIAWKPKDPITTFSTDMLNSGKITEEEIQEIYNDVRNQVEEAIVFAESSPLPLPEALYHNIYS
jgi:pyruvate dehydrogenase E1 component alpha subunit